MLTMAADRLPAALADLDPGSRALLDLSLRRGVSPTEIGELLRKDPEAVERGLHDILELLADALHVEGEDRREQVRNALTELPGTAWQARPPQAAQQAPPAPPAVPTPRDERPRAWPIALLVLIVSTLVVGSILLFSGGGDEEDKPRSPDARKTQPNEVPAVPADGQSKPRRARLAAVGGTNSGRGKVTLNADGDRLVVSIQGLPRPDGSYEIWLYNSLVDAKSLGSFRDTKIELDARLPDSLENYRYVDVSLERADGNPNHSGESVLRAPVDSLLIAE